MILCGDFVLQPDLFSIVCLLFDGIVTCFIPLFVFDVQFCTEHIEYTSKHGCCCHSLTITIVDDNGTVQYYALYMFLYLLFHVSCELLEVKQTREKLTIDKESILQAYVCVRVCIFVRGGRGRECDQEWFSDRSKFFF